MKIEISKSDLDSLTNEIRLLTESKEHLLQRLKRFDEESIKNEIQNSVIWRSETILHWFFDRLDTELGASCGGVFKDMRFDKEGLPIFQNKDIEIEFSIKANEELKKIYLNIITTRDK